MSNYKTGRSQKAFYIKSEAIDAANYLNSIGIRSAVLIEDFLIYTYEEKRKEKDLKEMEKSF